MKRDSIEAEPERPDAVAQAGSSLWTALHVPLWVLGALGERYLPTTFLLSLLRVYGYLRSYALRERAQRVRADASAAFPALSERSIRDTVRRHFEFLQMRNLAQSWPYRRDSHRLGRMTIENKHLLEEALHRQRGVILLTAHFGYGRLMKHVLRHHGFTAWTLGIRGADTPSANLERRIRQFFAAARVDKSEDNDLAVGINLRPILDVLRGNEIVLMTVDGKQASRFIDVNLFGSTVPFATGSLQLSQATGAAVLPAFVVDDPSQWFKVVLFPELEFHSGAGQDGEMAKDLQAFADTYQTVVLTYPHLHIWRRTRRVRNRKGKAPGKANAERYLRRGDSASRPD